MLNILFLGGPGLAVQLSVWGIDKNLCSDKKPKPYQSCTRKVRYFYLNRLWILGPAIRDRLFVGLVTLYNKVLLVFIS